MVDLDSDENEVVVVNKNKLKRTNSMRASAIIDLVDDEDKPKIMRGPAGKSPMPPPSQPRWEDMMDEGDEEIMEHAGRWAAELLVFLHCDEE